MRRQKMNDMNRIFICAVVLGLVSCADPAANDAEGTSDTDTTAGMEEEMPQETGSFGEAITEDGAITAEVFLAQMEGQTTLDAKMATKINTCCQKKGCWMMVDLGDGQEMRVTFKDYGFFVPLTSSGRDVVMQGNAYYDTTTVEMLRHYAEDEGLPQEEIDAITEPELALAFEATGVIVK